MKAEELQRVESLETQVRLAGDLGLIEKGVLGTPKRDIAQIERMPKSADKVIRKQTLESLTPGILGPSSPTKVEKIHKKILAIAFIAFMLLFLSGCSSAPSEKLDSVLSPPGTTTTVILVRHAERAQELGESALTPEGRQRAQALVAAIGDKEITAIYSPDRGRNRETVQPLARHLGVTITLIPEARLANTRSFAKEFVQEVLSNHAGGLVVWVGNKSPVGFWGGNLKEIYLRLGGPGDPPAKYDDLFIIIVPDQGAVRVNKTTYGKSAGRFDQ